MADHPNRYYDDGPGYIDTRTGFRVATADEVKEAHEKIPRTKANSHRATARGYAVPDDANGAGVLVEDGEIVPANVPVADEWMEKISKKSSAAEDAVLEAQQPLKDDPDYTQLSISSLQTLATDAGVTSIKGLSKDDLIAAIKAQRDNTR
jgi:hypothetical protein